MQTLISVFDSRSAARKAVDRLIQSGFAPDDVKVHEAAEPSQRQLLEIEQNDRGVFDSLGHFLVSIFGEDDGRKAADSYAGAAQRGHSVVIVDARNDNEAESAAVTLHECGALEVDDRETAGGAASLPGVRTYSREAPTLRDLAAQRRLREESLLADRAGQVSKEMKEDREERAYASAMNHVDRDRPK
jgi:hypothetical protein